MKNAFAIFPLFLPVLMAFACEQRTIPEDDYQKYMDKNTGAMPDTLTLKVGSKEFTATLFNNPTATAFKALLPLTINMTELNGNEKYFRLSENLPADASNPVTINSGDLMLWGSNTLVLFYETFSTSYSYTKLGKVTNPAGLARALGTGNVTVTIELLK